MPDFLVRRLHAMWQRKGLASALLLPFSLVVQGVVRRKRSRHARQGIQSQHPVIVVGNIYVGGTGKTPLVIALVQALRARGWHPGVISRGYGASPGKKARTGCGELDPREFGDEPAEIARVTQIPIAVHPCRVLALRALEQQWPDIDVVISDDGLQHLQLSRDIEFAVQDARGTGNGRLLPAGPLREPAERLGTVDYVVTNLGVGQTAPPTPETAATLVTMRLAPDHARHLASGTTLAWTDWLAQHGHRSIAALAGIGQPDRFFSMLRAGGISPDQEIALPDHYAFAESPFAALSSDLVLVTSKDATKCARFADTRVWAISARPQFSPDTWVDELHARLQSIALRKKRRKVN